MKYELVLTSRFKKGLKQAKRRGLNLSLLEDIVERLLHKIPLEAKYKDGAKQNTGGSCFAPFCAEDGTWTQENGKYVRYL